LLKNTLRKWKVLAIGSGKYNEKEDEKEKIVGFCVKCGRGVTNITKRVVSLGVKKEIYCERCFRKYFIQPVIQIRLMRYMNPNLFKRKKNV